MRIGSIYVITNSVSGKMYIGQTWVTLEQRLHSHFKTAFNSKSKSIFHCAVRSYGRAAFTIRQLGCNFFSQGALDEAERTWIRELRVQDRSVGYNILDGGGDSPMNHQESRDKLAATITGVKRSAESIAKQLKSREGFHHSEETKAKIRASNEGKKRAQETRDRVSAAAKRRGCAWLFASSAVAKSASSRTGRIVSQETRDKIGAKSRLKIMSPESRKRIADAIRKLRAERFWSSGRKSQSAITSSQV